MIISIICIHANSISTDPQILPDYLSSLPASHFKVYDLFKKFPDIGAIPQCGDSPCQNYMIGKR